MISVKEAVQYRFRSISINDGSRKERTNNALSMRFGSHNADFFRNKISIIAPSIRWVEAAALYALEWVYINIDIQSVNKHPCWKIYPSTDFM